MFYRKERHRLIREKSGKTTFKKDVVFLFYLFYSLPELIENMLEGKETFTFVKKQAGQTN